MLFFAAVSVLGYDWLAVHNRLVSWVPVTDFFLMTLATMRLVRLFTYDNIMTFVRDWFKDSSPESLAGSLGTLINCPWCSGLWFALVITFFYFATPIAWYAIFVLALGALASSFQVFTNWIGWSAEFKKKQVQSLPH